MENKRPFGLRDKLGYLFGGIGNDLSFIYAGSYLMVFYTEVLGISGSVAGLLFLLAGAAGIFANLVMGRMLDALKPSIDGRFRPWIRRMCVPAAAAGASMYLYWVRDWPYGARVAYAALTCLLWSGFGRAAVNIPYGSMISVISADIGERASLSVWRSLGSGLAGLAAGVLIPLFIYGKGAPGSEIAIPHRFTMASVILGVLSVTCHILCYGLCTERVSFVKKEDGKGESPGESSKSPERNRILPAVVCPALILLPAAMPGQIIKEYLFSDCFKNAKATEAVNLTGAGGMLFLAPFISGIAVNHGKKEAGASGMLAAGVIYIAAFFLRIRSVPAFMLLLFLAALGAGFFRMTAWAIIADIADHQKTAVKKREDGMVYAVYSSAENLGQVLAGGIYPGAALIPGICCILIFALMRFWYPLGKKEVEKIRPHDAECKKGIIELMSAGADRRWKNEI